MKQTTGYPLRLVFIFTVVFAGCQQVQQSTQSGRNSGADQHFSGRQDFHWPEDARAAVSITFDDARPSQLDVGIPVLDEYNVKATFYVLCEYVKPRASEWKKAVTAGHEIGNHTLNHFCTGNHDWAKKVALENQTLKTMRFDLNRANVAIESLLGVKPKTFAYPCGQKFIGRGATTRSYVPLVAEMFLAGRGWLDEATNDPEFCDLAQVMTRKLDRRNFRQLKELVDDAAQKGHWLVLAGHEVGQSAWQTTDAQALRRLCRYLTNHDNHIWVDTVEAVAAYIRQQRSNVLAHQSLNSTFAHASISSYNHALGKVTVAQQPICVLRSKE